MNKLPMSKRVAVVSALVEGNSLRSTCRMTSVAMNTVLKLLADLGEACATYHEEHVRNVHAKRIQCDEIWQFVYAKAKNVPEDKQATFGYGDVWTWTAIDADSKLMVSYMVGPRTPNMCYELMKDTASRLVGKVQLTTDGLYWIRTRSSTLSASTWTTRCRRRNMAGQNTRDATARRSSSAAKRRQ